LSAQVYFFGLTVVTDKAESVERDVLAANAALYHLPTSLSAYGDTTRYDLSSPVGLLEYVVEFVNRKPAQHSLVVGRERLRQLLRVAVHGADVNGPPAPDGLDLANPSEALISRCSDRSEIHLEPRFDSVPGGPEWRLHVHILGAEGFYNLIASLLMREENRARLKRCRYLGKAGKEPEPACEKFFIVQPRAKHDGPPNVLYCSHEHMRAANTAGSKARQSASRARKAALKIHGGASKVKAAADIKQAQLAHPDATPEELIGHVRRARKHK
jgi:hypothetical protein